MSYPGPNEGFEETTAKWTGKPPDKNVVEGLLFSIFSYRLDQEPVRTKPPSDHPIFTVLYTTQSTIRAKSLWVGLDEVDTLLNVFLQVAQAGLQ